MSKVDYVIEYPSNALENYPYYLSNDAYYRNEIKRDTIFEKLDDCWKILEKIVLDYFSSYLKNSTIESIIDWCNFPLFIIHEFVDGKLTGNTIDTEERFNGYMFKHFQIYLKDNAKDTNHVSYGILNGSDDEICWQAIAKSCHLDIPYSSTGYVCYGKCDKDQLVLLKLAFGKELVSHLTVKEIRKSLIDLNIGFEKIYSW